MTEPLIPPRKYPTGMSFEVIQDGIGVIRVTAGYDELARKQSGGVFTYDTEDYFRRDFSDKAFDLGFLKLIVDLSDVEFFDSSGIWVMYELNKKYVRNNGRVVYVVNNPHMIRWLEVKRFMERLTIVPEFGDAVDVLLKIDMGADA